MSARVARGPRALVIGDLLLDVVVGPTTDPGRGLDVNGRVVFRQGGSAATTARWLARLGQRTALITSVGRDPLGRALVGYMKRCGVLVHATRARSAGTGRMGVLLDLRGERSFVADRRAATALPVTAIRPAWLRHAALVHIPAYSLFGEPLTQATLHLGRLAREAGALVSVDLASAAFIAAAEVERLRRQVTTLQPGVIFATSAEAEAFLGGKAPAAELTAFTPLAILKRGRLGATIFVRGREAGPVDVPTTPLEVADATGAGDAFAAGVLASLCRTGLPIEAIDMTAIIAAVRAGHRAARRQLSEPRPELRIGD